MWAMGLTLVAAFGMGLSQDGPDEVTLRQLTIVDEEGQKRIVLGAGVTEPGKAGINYFDRQVMKRMGMGTLAEGSTGITVYDRDEAARITTGVAPDGASFINLLDSNENPRILNRVGASVPSGTFYFDSNGKTRIITTVNRGSAGTNHYDLNGDLRITTGTNSSQDETTSGSVHVDSDGNVRIWMGIDTHGHALGVGYGAQLVNRPVADAENINDKPDPLNRNPMKEDTPPLSPR
jgi:hypothetical protein